MPETYYPKSRIYPLSAMTDRLDLLRVKCTVCKKWHAYYPADLLQIFGDVDVDSLMHRMNCESCGAKGMDVQTFLPSGPERVGLRIRKLVSIKIKRIPVWRED
jgi:C4-type Zn-finger protein